MEATKVCSLGQITSALFEVGGQYRRKCKQRITFCSVRIAYPDVNRDLNKNPFTGGFFILLLISIEMSLKFSEALIPISIGILQKTHLREVFLLGFFYHLSRQKRVVFLKKSIKTQQS
jgi:hypothetical protein